MDAKRVSYRPYRKHLTFRHREASRLHEHLTFRCRKDAGTGNVSPFSAYPWPSCPVPEPRQPHAWSVARTLGAAPSALNCCPSKACGSVVADALAGQPLVRCVCDGRCRATANWIEPNDDRGWLIDHGKSG